jgi:hypothetical protein
MSRSKSKTRRIELVELMRQPAPGGYNTAPQNRAQRRELRRRLAAEARRERKAR